MGKHSQGKSKENLMEIFSYTCTMFQKHNINFIPFYGTLLGIIREKDFIKNDDDVDILMDFDDYERLKNMITEEKIKTKRYTERIIQLYLPNKLGPIDIYTYHKLEKDILIKWDGMLLYSKEDIFPLNKITFKGFEIDIPCNSHKILKETYGKNYLTPISKKKYNWGKINTVRKQKD